MQRFPPVDENGSNVLNASRPFRSTDYVNNNLEIPIVKSSVNQTSPKPKGAAPVGNGRARSCSGGRNKALSPPVLSRKGYSIDTSLIIDEHLSLGSCGQAESNGDIDKRTRKITHRIAELFSLIKENQTDR
jgi:hypothetical protein